MNDLISMVYQAKFQPAMHDFRVTINLERKEIGVETKVGTDLCGYDIWYQVKNSDEADACLLEIIAASMFPDWPRYWDGDLPAAMLERWNQLKAKEAELNALERSTSEAALNAGLYGGAEASLYGNISAQDAYNRQLQAASLLDTASQLGGRYQAAVLGSMPPQVQRSALYASSVDQLTGVATGSPIAAQQSGSQAYLANTQSIWNAQVATTGAQTQQANYQSSMNNAYTQQQAQSNAAMMGALGTVFGAGLGFAVGGPPGAMVGAGAGAAVGGGTTSQNPGSGSGTLVW